MIAFGFWDIFYYIWLYLLVGWPESLLTWDILFYVPLPWVGPVITPVLIRSEIPSPFAWRLYLPGYLFSIAYFAVRLRQSIRSGR